VNLRPIAIAGTAAALLGGSAVAAGQAGKAHSAGSAAASSSTAPGPGVRAGVVLNALDNPFFVAVYAGVADESRRRGIATTVRSVTSNAAQAAQAAQVRRTVRGGAGCYVVNPITATNLVGALRGVRAPIVDVDSPLDPSAARRAGVKVATYIGTDDFAAGRLAGRRMAALLHGRGAVALVGGLATNVNSGVRLRGFRDGLRGTAVRVAARVDADYDRTKAEIATRRIVREHPDVGGFFAASDLMALGVSDALRATDSTKKIEIIGLDGIPEAMDAVRSGTLSATVSQYPYIMGQMAVEACAAAATGERLPARVDAPIALLTRDNVDRAIAAFPKPFAGYADPLR
jgi:ribose transport system substrate-binding protein